MSIKIGNKYTFDYPEAFVTKPEYTKHAGQVVTVISYVPSDADCDPELEKLWRVKAEDGWEGDAFESELKALRKKAVELI